MWAWITRVWNGFWTWLGAGGAFAIFGKVFFLIVVACLAPRIIDAFLGGAVAGWQYGWRASPPAQSAVVQPATAVSQPAAAAGKQRRVMKPGDGDWFELDPVKDSIEIELPPLTDYFFQPPENGWVGLYVDGQLKDRFTYQDFLVGKQLSSKSWVFTLRGGPAGSRVYLRLGD